MKKNKRTTMAVTADRKIKLERMAINISSEVGKQITWTDIVNYLIDNCSGNVIQDLTDSIKS